MKIIRHAILWLTLALPFAGMVPHALSQNFKASLDTTSIKIGEQVTLRLDATVPSGTRVGFPPVPDTLGGGIEVISRSKIDSSATATPGYIQYKQSLRITAFDSGSITIPPFRFSYNQQGIPSATAITDSLLLRVETVAVDTTQAIRDIKAVMSQPVTFAELIPFLTGGVLVAVIGALIWYYLWRKKQNKPFLPILRKPEPPAWEAALIKLSAIENEKLWQSGKLKGYYSEITDTLRLYLEKQFGIMALEMITPDILSALKSREIASPAAEKLSEILQLADMVKFAREKPLPDENARTMSLARAFVNETKPAEEPKTVNTAVENQKEASA